MNNYFHIDRSSISIAQAYWSGWANKFLQMIHALSWKKKKKTINNRSPLPFFFPFSPFFPRLVSPRSLASYLYGPRLTRSSYKFVYVMVIIRSFHVTFNLFPKRIQLVRFDNSWSARIGFVAVINVFRFLLLRHWTLLRTRISPVMNTLSLNTLAMFNIFQFLHHE